MKGVFYIVNVLIGCEFSGRVRDAFRRRGHNAVSCDLLESESPGPHIKGDVLGLLNGQWDMLIAFPPCTFLCRSGSRWWGTRTAEQEAAIDFVRQLLAAPISRIAVENPIGILSTRLRKPDQILQPWQFGHRETKATCLWLKHLPPLFPCGIQSERLPCVHLEPPSPDRWKNRSRTYSGIAEAMAEQWGKESV